MVLRTIAAYLLIFQASPAFSAMQERGSNAGCLIHSNEHVLLVRDLWSGKLSLPGGTHEQGETAEQTALREVAEETGLNVVIGPELRRLANGFEIFECLPEDGRLSLLEGKWIDHPKSGWNEISEAIWVDPAQISLEEWRFQSQKAVVIELMLANAQSPLPLQVVRAESSAAEWQIKELRVIEMIQARGVRLTELVFRFLSFLGSVEFFLLLIPLLWVLRGRRLGRDAAYLLISSSLAHAILKQVFAWSRPFHLLPHLKLASAEGFGFPSGHATAAVVAWGFVALQFGFKGRWIMAVLLALGTGLARVYLGVHFPHDVLGGWILGGIVVALYAWAQKVERAPTLSTKRWAWVLIPLSVAAVGVRFHPETVALAMFLLGMALGLRITDESRAAARADQLVRLVVVIVGLFSILILGRITFPAEATFLACLLHRVVLYAALGLWMSAAGSGLRIRVK